MKSPGSSWGAMSGKEDEAPPQKFTDEDVKGWLDGGSVNRESGSTICMALYGDDGVGKSGVVLDCRNEEATEKGKRVIAIDLDGSCGPLKEKFWKNDDNIIVLDPTMLLPDGNIDYVTTYNKVLAIVRYITQEQDTLNLQAVIVDGLDTLLKTCEYVMRYEDLKVDPDVQIKDQWQWSRRNRRYYTVVQLIKRLKCDSFFTTHLKEVKDYRSGKLATKGKVPGWHENTPGMMFQKVFLERTSSEGITTFTATIEKAKGALELEGKVYPVAEVSEGKTTWNGLKELFKDIRGS